MSKKHPEHHEAKHDAGPDAVVALYTSARALVDAAVASGAVGPLTADLKNAVEAFEKIAGSTPAAEVA